MIIRAVLLAALLLSSPGGAQPAAAPASNLKLVDLTDDFAALWDRTAELDDAARVAAFKTHFHPIIPGFYSHERHGLPDATKYDPYLLKALEGFPSQRAEIESMSRRFASLIAPAEQSFERQFGPLNENSEIFLVHSLGEFDGGMRTLGGKGYLMFGADMMAQIYADKDIQPFFHHELFHLYHSRRFDDCASVWCNLWTEGLATYVSHRMNPEATDDELLLTSPVPLRTAVESNKQEAICAVRARLDSTERDDNMALFSSGRLNERLPSRFGYYVGYLVAADLGRTRDLQELALLNGEQVRPLIDQSLDAMASCPATERASGERG